MIFYALLSHSLIMHFYLMYFNVSSHVVLNLSKAATGVEINTRHVSIIVFMDRSDLNSLLMR